MGRTSRKWNMRHRKRVMKNWTIKDAHAFLDADDLSHRRLNKSLMREKPGDTGGLLEVIRCVTEGPPSTILRCRHSRADGLPTTVLSSQKKSFWGWRHVRARDVHSSL